jgi:phosphatidate cytidylyltransferase
MRRVLTALALIPSVSWIIFLGPPWLFFAVIFLFAALCYREYARLLRHHNFENFLPVGYGAGLLLLALPTVPAAVPILLALLGLALALRCRDLSIALPSAAAFLLGLLYVFGAWRTALELRSLSPHWLFAAVALNWVGDTAAYYVGSAIGKHKLSPRISPGKSWEGAIASTLFSAAFVMTYLAWALPQEPLAKTAFVGVFANVAGQMGDLAESALKRGAGVKDSGTMLPGHGGWLDRLDSSLFSMPVVYGILRLL